MSRIGNYHSVFDPKPSLNDRLESISGKLAGDHRKILLLISKQFRVLKIEYNPEKYRRRIVIMNMYTKTVDEGEFKVVYEEFNNPKEKFEWILSEDDLKRNFQLK